MDSRKYSMYRFFFGFRKMLLFYVWVFVYRFRKMFFEAEIIDSVFYVSHLDCTYIYIYLFIYIHTYIFIHIHIIYT